MSTILFVDDDLAFLESIQRVFKSWSQGAPIIVKTAHSVGDAIMTLQEMPVNVVVIDIRMPVVDGLQFLRLLNRKHPTVQKAILTGYAEEEYRTACLAHGAALFLEKPRNTDEMKSVYAALVQLVEFPETRGFSGVIQQASLADMLQMLCTGGNSLVLQVKSREGLAEIFIREGSVIHATVNELEGYDAFYHVMTLRGGEFHTRPFVDPPKCTISNSWEFLLMESARLLDESGALDEPPVTAYPSPIPIPQTTRVLSPRSSPPAGRKTPSLGFLDERKLPPLPSVPSFSAHDQLDELSIPAVKPPRQKETVPIEFKSIRLAGNPEKKTARGPLDELVLCSQHGGLIKSFGSANAQRRVDLLELFSVKLRQITGRPEWGNFEYLAIEGKDYTATIEFPEGSGAFGMVRQKGVAAEDVRASVADAIQGTVEFVSVHS